MSQPMSTATDHVESAIIDALAEPTLLVTVDGTVVAANRAVLDLCGRSADAVIGVRLAELLDESPEKLSRCMRLWSRSLTALPGSLRFHNNGHATGVRCDGSILRPNERAHNSS